MIEEGKSMLSILRAEDQIVRDIEAKKAWIKALEKARNGVASYPVECEGKSRDLLRYDCDIKTAHTALIQMEDDLSHVRYELICYIKQLFGGDGNI